MWTVFVIIFKKKGTEIVTFMVNNTWGVWSQWDIMEVIIYKK